MSMTTTFANRRCGRLAGIWVLAILISSCQRETEAPAAEHVVTVAVRVTPVARGDVSATLQIVGETLATTTMRLASPVAGRITYLPFQPGDRIANAQAVARIIPLESEAALQGFALLDQAGVTHKGAQQALRRLAAQEIALPAPFSAMVAARLHYPGEHVAASEPLIELFDPSSVFVEAQAPVAQTAQLRVGMDVQVSTGSSTALGKIAAIGGTVSAQSLTLSVRIHLTTPLDPPLLHAPVACRIALETHSNVLVIPRAALLSPTTDKAATVMLAIDTHAERRQIELGLLSDDAIEVVNGLTQGERLIIEGAYGLPDGAAIHRDDTAEAATP